MKKASKTESELQRLQEEARNGSNENMGMVKSKTVDDYSRVRVFHDQSLKDDLLIPFGTHQTGNTLYAGCL